MKAVNPPLPVKAIVTITANSAVAKVVIGMPCTGIMSREKLKKSSSCKTRDFGWSLPPPRMRMVALILALAWRLRTNQMHEKANCIEIVEKYFELPI